MWTALIGLAASVIPAILKLFGGGDDKSRADSIELGEKRQQVATHAADNATIHAANEAAKKAAQEPLDAPDPNDRDNAR